MFQTLLTKTHEFQRKSVWIKLNRSNCSTIFRALIAVPSTLEAFTSDIHLESFSLSKGRRSPSLPAIVTNEPAGMSGVCVMILKKHGICGQNQ
jgi:hypothetical protein